VTVAIPLKRNKPQEGRKEVHTYKELGKYLSSPPEKEPFLQEKGRMTFG